MVSIRPSHKQETNTGGAACVSAPAMNADKDARRDQSGSPPRDSGREEAHLLLAVSIHVERMNEKKLNTHVAAMSRIVLCAGGSRGMSQYYRAVTGFAWT